MAMISYTNRGRAVGALLALSAALAPAAAADERVRLAFDAGWTSGERSFDSLRAYPEFAETTRVSAHHAAELKSQFSGELQVRVLRHLGVAVAFAGSSTDGRAAVSASVPHPLYLGRDRRLALDLDGLNYSEKAVHADVVALHAAGPWRLRAFAGLSFFSVETRVAGNITYRQSYPFDVAELTAVATNPIDGSSTGFNLGAGVDWLFSRHVGLGGQARFSRATLEPSATDGEPLRLEPGGFAASLGLRIVF